MKEISKIGPAELWGQISSSASREAQKEENIETSTQGSNVQEGGKNPIDQKTLNPFATMPRPSSTSETEMPKDPVAESVSVESKDVVSVESRAVDFHLDQAERLMSDSFPHPPEERSTRVPATIPNVQYLFDRYGIIARYNVIKKTPEFIIPGLVCSLDNADNVAMANIKSLAKYCKMSVTNLEETALAVADRHQYNPVADWILSKPWDGLDRLQGFYETLTEREGFPKPFKDRLMYRWGLSLVAAVFEPVGFKARGVLTLQGAQGIGKTSWVASLIPDVALRESVVKLDHHLDAGNKDSQIAAATHFLVELGELDSSFRRDVARLKGFITSPCDKIRLPYARSASNFPRRTIFCATVNDERFLVDATGNSRWWTVPVDAIDYEHNLDMQQVFAQLKIDYDKGEKWWLTKAEEEVLENLNRDHRVVSVVEERLMPLLDLTRKNEEGLPALTASELLMKAGYRTVSNPQAKECGELLRYHLGPPKKINGYMKWRIPFARHAFTKIDDY